MNVTGKAKVYNISTMPGHVKAMLHEETDTGTLKYHAKFLGSKIKTVPEGTEIDITGKTDKTSTDRVVIVVTDFKTCPKRKNGI